MRNHHIALAGPSISSYVLTPWYGRQKSQSSQRLIRSDQPTDGMVWDFCLLGTYYDSYYRMTIKDEVISCVVSRSEGGQFLFLLADDLSNFMFTPLFHGVSSGSQVLAKW